MPRQDLGSALFQFCFIVYYYFCKKNILFSTFGWFYRCASNIHVAVGIVFFIYSIGHLNRYCLSADVLQWKSIKLHSTKESWVQFGKRHSKMKMKFFKFNWNSRYENFAIIYVLLIHRGFSMYEAFSFMLGAILSICNVKLHGPPKDSYHVVLVDEYFCSPLKIRIISKHKYTLLELECLHEQTGGFLLQKRCNIYNIYVISPFLIKN